MGGAIGITADPPGGAMPDDATGAIRVLVVDDQSAIRSIIRQLLHQVGIEDVAEAECPAKPIPT